MDPMLNGSLGDTPGEGRIPDLVTRASAARLLQVLLQPDAAAIVAHLPRRPGARATVEDVAQASGLDQKRFGGALSSLVGVGLLRTADGQVELRRDFIDGLTRDLVADSPLASIPAEYPKLKSFVRNGRWEGMPTSHPLQQEMWSALARLVEPGESLSERDLNERIAMVHDDPAAVRRGLCDNGHLTRDPATLRYTAPLRDE